MSGAGILILILVTAVFAPPEPGPQGHATPVTHQSSPLGVRMQPVAVFLGDSYTQGFGASTESAIWASVLSAREGWTGLNLGRGGTGFVSTSSVAGCGAEYCPSYREMIPDAVADAPDIVLIAGGQNDFPEYVQDEGAVTTAIIATFRSVRAQLPSARIIAVGPSTPWAIDETAIGFDSAVRSAAAEVKAIYVSLLAPNVVDPAFVLPDGTHVNDAGQAAIADRVAGELRAWH